jgi:hypothetical protein
MFLKVYLPLPLFCSASSIAGSHIGVFSQQWILYAQDTLRPTIPYSQDPLWCTFQGHTQRHTPNFIEIHPVFVTLNHANKYLPTDINSIICINFMCFMQRMHNKLLLLSPKYIFYIQEHLFTVKRITVSSPENHIKKNTPQTAVL